MKMFQVALALGVFAFGVTPAHSTTIIKLAFDVTITSQFDYLTGTYEPITVPTTAQISVSFPTTTTSIDYGTTTITNFGQLGETVIGYPLLSYVGTDPYGDGLGSLGQSAYTFPNVSDYPSEFIEQFAFQDNIYHASSGFFWTFHSEIRVTRRSPGLGGTGTADYAFDTNSLVAFLNDFQKNPAAYDAYFNQSWEHFAVNSEGIGGTSLGGKDWSGTVALVNPVSVPEPATWAMMVIGFGSIGGAVRSARRNSKASTNHSVRLPSFYRTMYLADIKDQ